MREVVRSMSRGERLEFLMAAADVLEGRFPSTQSTLCVFGLEAHAALKWPGIVEVRLRRDGTLIARSKSGSPRELAD